MKQITQQSTKSSCRDRRPKRIRTSVGGRTRRPLTLEPRAVASQLSFDFTLDADQEVSSTEQRIDVRV